MQEQLQLRESLPCHTINCQSLDVYPSVSNPPNSICLVFLKAHCLESLAGIILLLILLWCLIGVSGAPYYKILLNKNRSPFGHLRGLVIGRADWKISEHFGAKKSSPGSSKKQPWNHIGALLTPATPNFNVVIGRPPNTKCRQQHWSRAEGTVHHVCGVVLHGMAVFLKEPGIMCVYVASESHIWQSEALASIPVPWTFSRLRVFLMQSTCAWRTWGCTAEVVKLTMI